MPTSSEGHDLVFVNPEDAAEYPAEFKACASKKPVDPPELDPAKNPNYLDDYRSWIKCMNDKGLAAEGVPDGGGWRYADRPGRVRPHSKEAGKIADGCEIEAFSQGN